MCGIICSQTLKFCKILLSCLLAYSGGFAFNSQFGCSKCWQYHSAVMCWPVYNSSDWTIHFRNTPNTKNLCTMVSQLFSWCGLLARFAPWFSALILTVRLPFFLFNVDTIQKNLYFFIGESEVYMYKIAFPCLLASIHMAPDFLPFETLPSI